MHVLMGDVNRHRRAVLAGNLLHLDRLVVGVVPGHRFENWREFAVMQALEKVGLVVGIFDELPAAVLDENRGTVGHARFATPGFFAFSHLLWSIQA